MSRYTIFILFIISLYSCDQVKLSVPDFNEDEKVEGKFNSLTTWNYNLLWSDDYDQYKLSTISDTIGLISEWDLSSKKYILFDNEGQVVKQSIKHNSSWLDKNISYSGDSIHELLIQDGDTIFVKRFQETSNDTIFKRSIFKNQIKNNETYIIDNKRRVISLMSDSFESYAYRFFYDKRGRIKSIESYNSNALSTKSSIDYNSHNNKEKIVIEYFNNSKVNFVANLEYFYSYDRFGNWRSRMEYNNGYPVALIVRHIEY